MNFVQRARELFTVAPSPILAANESSDLAACERYLMRGWATVIRMLFEKCDEDLVRERAGLTNCRVGTNDDRLRGALAIECNLLCAHGRALLIVTEQSTRYAKQRVLQVKLSSRLRFALLPINCLIGLHNA